ncbi:MAG: hypothetical protein HYW95_00020 [Candidatus Wildermuthbacteria bacterium]|nr:hypothetical protein [Candidatus Wildermuthbacteria bacterium]
MEKQIITIGYIIPTFDENHIDFYSGASLMDADILLISPESFEPRGGYGSWIEFSSGGGCYNASTSSEYEKKISHLKKEVTDFLQSGKSVFVILSKEESHLLSSGVSHPRKGENLHSTYTKTNYDFLPISIGTLVSASGKNIEFSGNPLFSDFHEKFKKSLEYQLYIENPGSAQVIFTGKDKTKILGAIYKVKNGHLVVLPLINYDEKKFTEHRGKGKEKKAYWTKEAIQFGKSLVKTLVDVDKALRKSGDRTPPPDWTSQADFQLTQEQVLQKEIEKKSTEIDKLISQKSELQEKIEQEVRLRDLLFEKGKILENAINIALEILGYTAENYNDGNLEIDHVITSPEKDRFIGEAEGKDTSAVNIEKFSQLTRIIQEDLRREEVENPAIGILFGNGFRLTKPSERVEQFTTKCISTAKSLNCVLVRTPDLFRVAKYVKESRDDSFAKSCRDVIKDSIGKIVDFPEIPKT